ncbi:MAG: PDZ domain-containing protein [Phycisphaerales bacterium]|jgi:hypothetical protein
MPKANRRGVEELAAGVAGLIFCAGVACSAGVAFAGGGTAGEFQAEANSEPGLDDAWLSARVTQLDDSDFAAREAASNEIAARNKTWMAEIATEMATTPDLSTEARRNQMKQRIDDRNRQWLGAIEGRLAGDGELSAEQRERLMQVGTRLFSELPHGAMGVQFSRVDRGEGVEISAVVTGFDAENTLKPGDAVLEIDGRRLSAQSDMRAVIISHDPGDRLSMTLMRRGERVVVSLKLGDFANLRAPALSDHSLMRDALEERIARRAGRVGAVGSVIEPGIESGEWAKLQLSSGERLANSRFNRGQREDFLEDEGRAKMAEIAVGGPDRLGGVGDPSFSANQPAPDDVRTRELLAARQKLMELYAQAQREMRGAADGRAKLIAQSQLRNVESQIQQLDEQLQNVRRTKPGEQRRVRGGFVRP